MKILTVKIMAIATTLLWITSCNSTEKLILNKEYDAAIKQLSEKLISAKSNEKAVLSLSEAFHQANQLDHDRILLLKSQGQPEIWVELYERYMAMQNRQTLIEKLPEAIQGKINFHPIDLENQIAESKVKAQRYLFAKAEELQKSGSKSDAITAYHLLLKLKMINADYPEIDALLRQALLNGASRVLFSIDNETGIKLSNSVLNNLMNFSDIDPGKSKVNFSLTEESGQVYDYRIIFRLNSITISPDRIEKRTFTEQTDTTQGKTHKTIVNEVIMSKNCEIKGSVNYVNLSNEVVFSTPLNAKSSFKYEYATINGDAGEISPRTALLIRKNAIPFPANEFLVLDASKQFNQLIKKVVFNENVSENSGN